MNEQFEKDAAFYWSVCILRRLRDMGLLTEAEYRKILQISSDHYGTQVFV
jgi:hypothetical protein